MKICASDARCILVKESADGEVAFEVLNASSRDKLEVQAPQPRRIVVR